MTNPDVLMNPPTTQNRRILVIDDNRTIHDDFRKILSKRDGTDTVLDEAEAAIFGALPSVETARYQVDAASQGEEGKKMVEQAMAEGRPYALAFVDMRMPPGWDGIETIKRIWEVCPDLQIVICTAYADCSWVELQEKTNPLDRLLILRKPFDPVEVLQLAHALTEKWRLLQESRTRLTAVERMVAERTQELEAARIAALNMMEDAVRNREKSEQAYEDLKREVAERRQVEQQLRQSQKMEAFGQLAGGVAHDFNNILAVIMGYSTLLMDDEAVDEGIKEHLKQVYSAGERAANLTRQLLTFSRKKEMQVNSLNLNEVIDNITKMLGRIIGEDIKLQCRCPSTLPPIQADEGMMEQVLMNLAVNARDAMPKGGQLSIGTDRVTTDAAHVQHNPEAQAGDFICLSVRDTGCGMTQEVRARIFEPFFTTKGVGKGTGLGLATVFGIVKQHQGWIEVESHVGVGTTFKVFLPVSPNLEAADEKTTPRTQIRRGTETILLVEDEVALRGLTKITLQRFGYRVLEAASGVDALSVWEQHGSRIDLLLTDMVMPDGLAGRELARQLQARKPDLKVIYVSGYSMDSEGTGFRAREGVTFLQKPYQSQKLAQAVRNLLDGKANP
ncbi:MAG TPA: response regulator [Verrucomicrobiae bacterium]|nr:response regulator [Verrucomicrobiae bacterium]